MPPVPGTDSIIDLSHWNPVVDFPQIKNSGVSAILHKASQGLGTDPAYWTRYNRAKSFGMQWGAYHFGVKGHSAMDQADHFIQTAGSKLLALDWEWNGADTMTEDQAEEFVSAVFAKTRRWPMLYTSQAFLETTDPLRWAKTLLNCDLWLTGFSETPVIPPQWDNSFARQGKGYRIWQHGIGECPGIVGQVDRDTFNGTPEELAAYFA